MAFDGITIAAIKHELNQTILNGRIHKIAQPEPDEILLSIKGKEGNYRLIMSANPSLPLCYLTEENKVSPLSAPPFCMLLRKHLQNGRIVNITQPDFERILVFHIEHLNELGDLCEKQLIVELMGKYSNIIFATKEGMILDSIKHVSAAISSVREVLPGREYFIPTAEGKVSPIDATKESFFATVFSKHLDPFKAIMSSYTGVSPIIAHEIASSADVDGQIASELTEDKKEALYLQFCTIFQPVRENTFTPTIYLKNEVPSEYSMVSLPSYEGASINDTLTTKSYDSVSMLIKDFYSQKEKHSRNRQKSADLRKIITTILERDVKKYDLQIAQLKDTDKMEQYRIYGELLQTYGYSVAQGSKSVTVDNYYTNEPLTIPLNPDLSAIDNAKRYFDKYGKCKRTKEALTELIISVKDEITHLESILTALDIAEKEEDLNEIREEIIESGYIRRKGKKQKDRFKSKPFHYISSDGFHMFVGKNNLQNEELTFKVATGNDWWFHAKGSPGSHVIVKCENKELPDRVYEEAAALAAYYSKAKDQALVEIDYIQKKQIKKVPGSKPGFVIYHTNYSMAIAPSIEKLQLVE